jgi:hypothetical protein
MKRKGLSMEQNKVKQKGEPKKEDFGSPVFLGRKIAAPGKTLRVRIEVIPKGTVLHRCHDAQYPGDSFNPGRVLLPNERVDTGRIFSPSLIALNVTLIALNNKSAPLP